MAKNLILIGSTGSIGTQTLDVVRSYPDLFHVTALAAGRNTKAMEAQIREFRPGVACMWSEEAAADLRVRVADLDVEVVSGMDGLIQLASLEEGDVFLNAVVGRRREFRSSLWTASTARSSSASTESPLTGSAGSC